MSNLTVFEFSGKSLRFKYRYGIDILARAKNQNVSGLIIAAQIPISKTGGVAAVELLFAIASEVLV